MILTDGSLVDEALLSPDLVDDMEDDAMFQQSLLNGLAGVVGNIPVQNMQKQTVSDAHFACLQLAVVLVPSVQVRMAKVT